MVRKKAKIDRKIDNLIFKKVHEKAHVAVISVRLMLSSLQPEFLYILLIQKRRRRDDK